LGCKNKGVLKRFQN